MALQQYLKDNTLVRENIVDALLQWEFKHAAAKRGYYLKIYKSIVDIEGFDLILDDDDMIQKMQVKSMVDSKTNSWDIHRNILRPVNEYQENYGFSFGVGCPRDEGGVLLVDVIIDKSDDIKLKYHYTNVIILIAMELGVIKTNRESKSTSETLMRSLRNEGRSHDTIALTRGAFLQLKNAEACLAVAGFHTNYHSSALNNLARLEQLIFNPPEDFSQKEARREGIIAQYGSAIENVKELIDPDFSISFGEVQDLIKRCHLD